MPLNNLVVKFKDRRKVWLQRSGADELAAKNTGLYEVFLERELPSQVAENIEKDLDRTQPAMKGEKKGALRRVLRAVASFLSEIRYVQGLNYLAATLLYHLEAEAEVFWIMIQLFKRYNFTEYYKRGMPGLQSFFQVLELGIQLHAPSLAEHFVNESIMVNMFSMKWAITLFGCKSKIEHSAAIMDIFLAVGWDFIINFSLALLIQAQKTMLSLPSEDILVFIETIPVEMSLEKTLQITSILMHKTHKWKLKQSSSSLNSSSSSVGAGGEPTSSSSSPSPSSPLQSSAGSSSSLLPASYSDNPTSSSGSTKS